VSGRSSVPGARAHMAAAGCVCPGLSALVRGGTPSVQNEVARRSARNRARSPASTAYIKNHSRIGSLLSTATTCPPHATATILPSGIATKRRDASILCQEASGVEQGFRGESVSAILRPMRQSSEPAPNTKRVWHWNAKSSTCALGWGRPVGRTTRMPSASADPSPRRLPRCRAVCARKLFRDGRARKAVGKCKRIADGLWRPGKMAGNH
jgi:hypothetical protein